MAQAVKDSFVRDVINGDAESRAHWFTYAIGTIAGTKGASSAIKSTRVGSNALRNAKDIANKSGDIKMPNISLLIRSINSHQLVRCLIMCMMAIT